MGVAIESGVVERLHRYLPIELASGVDAKTQALPREAFEIPKKKRRTLPFEQITGVGKPPYYSPAAIHNTTPHADDQLIADVKAKKDWSLLEWAFLGQVVNWRHRLVLEVNRADLKGKRHVVSGHCCPDSSTLVWPVTLRKIAGHRYLQFPDESVSEPELVSVFSYHVTEVRAASYVWHSWLWQLQNIPGVASKLKPGIRAFPLDDFEPVPVVLCKRAFFALDRIFIRKVAEEVMRVALDSGLTLFGCLFETLKAYMKWGVSESWRRSRRSASWTWAALLGIPS